MRDTTFYKESPPHRLTADKGEIKDFPKMPSATSFIRKTLAVISSKVTLRERIAQTGYWKLKLFENPATKHIKVYFITPDEDGTLTQKKPTKKGRAIVEVDLDGSYVLTEEEIEESSKVKLFEHFIDDLKRLLKNGD